MDNTSSDQLSAPSCSSSSSSTPLGRWEVFLSFYGKDTRASFIAHLYQALDQAGIQTFRDDPALEKGDEISPALFKAIRSSNKFVVVLSENYAYSPWCLDELVEILSCKRRKKVIPVFYYVNPTDVRYHKESFAKAIDYHYQKKRYSDDMIDKWKSALAEIGDLSGYHFKKDTHENEADTIQKIVEEVAPPKVLHLEKYVIGIDSAVKAIHLKLKMESNDVRAIVIWGMGGIGKTTTAKTFFNKYSNKFDINCFIENAKQYSMLSLLEQLLIELLKKKDYKVPNLESGIRELQQILLYKKALIVLDDLEQLELLVKIHNLFSPGSKIIVTSRNARLQNKLKVDISEVDVYEVKGLGEIESLKLFSYHAFNKTVPPESFKEVSEGFVSYAGGLPLALKVFGSSLRSRTEVSFWKAQLEIVRKFPENEIQLALQVGYDGLDNQTQKDIFLDIAFFFVGKDKDEAVHVFNSCGFFPDAGIPILVERCLLTIDENNKFQMHNLIQDMGMELGKNRGLFWRGNEWEDLQDLEQKNKIEGLILDLSTSRERQMSAEIFKDMPKVRLLEIIGSHDIKGNFNSSFRELRCIRWSNCPWTSLPSDFRPRKLVSIYMPYNNLNTLWNDATPLVSLSLKTIDLSYSRNLKTTPDSRHLKTVEKLLLHDCTNLKRLPEQLGDMKGLKILDASWSAIEQLPDSIGHLKELYELNLCACSELNKLPEQLWDMEGLRKLYLSVNQLPDSIGHLKELVELNLYSCWRLNKLPEQIGDMEGLRKLDVGFSGIRQLPDSIGLLSSLQELILRSCIGLEKLPEQLGDMKGLRKLDASDTRIEQLPDSIGGLINLVHLNLNRCRELNKLPDSIGGLINLGQCSQLTSLPNSICKLKLLKVLRLGDCSELERLPKQLGKMQSLQCLYLNGCSKLEYLPDSIGLLTRLQELELYGCEKLEYLPDSIRLLSSLQELYLFGP